MARTIILIPVTLDADLGPVAKELENLLVKNVIHTVSLPAPDCKNVEQFLIANRLEDFLETVVRKREEVTPPCEVILTLGVPLTKSYAAELNFSIATALGAAVIFVMPQNTEAEAALQQLEILAAPYQHRYHKTILGLVINCAGKEKREKLALKFPLLKDPSGNLDFIPIQKFLQIPIRQSITPALFKYRLIKKACGANKIIVLPEGDEPRTIAAANICAKRGIARCVLLGEPEKIDAISKQSNLSLHENIQVIAPRAVVDKYVVPLYEERKAKGLTMATARKQLDDNVVLGTMMLHLGEADGLVSGAVHTTANTIRPALQIIKTPPPIKIVSSIFFMCLPDQILVYSDCAINPNPTAEELADIAIQSADSAAAFGITPRIAMLSYSTWDSGVGPSVDKVREATAIVKKLRSDLEIDGPLQYDAAVSEKTAHIKAPGSRVAGQATVFIMPNLDVGNIIYKAVQRVTGIACVGPMLQGLRKPVNDLSRGCSIDDIVFTISVAAVQAMSINNEEVNIEKQI